MEIKKIKHVTKLEGTVYSIEMLANADHANPNPTVILTWTSDLKMIGKLN